MTNNRPNEIIVDDEWLLPTAMADAFQVAMKTSLKGNEAETVDYENVEVGTQLKLPIKTTPSRIKG